MMRVHELAKMLDCSSKQLLDFFKKNKVKVVNHMSVLSDEQVDMAEKNFSSSSSQSNEEISSQGFDQEMKPVYKEPILLGDLAERIGVPSSQVILHLLQSGVACNKNQEISVELLEKLSEFFGFELIGLQAQEEDLKFSESENLTSRPPVVVIVGHVDHGKTTLLDHIRKTRVVEKEKGGITQHLGAYKVDSPQGKLIFLDTPGHEAFTLMRQRGLKIADIAILVVAADDGIMPQTIEAIDLIKKLEVPVVVAINKIDKANEKQVEKLKTMLAQHGLVSEEWGGDAVMVPISAKHGTNIDNLLEMVSLQGDVLELGADPDMPAEGFVLEVEKKQGVGSSATFLAVNGTLKVGDCFVSGKSYGKVNSIIDCRGKRLSEVGPAIPVKISGFDLMPSAGDFLKAVSSEDYKKLRKSSTSKKPSTVSQSKFSADLKIILKSDTESTGDAIINSLNKVISSQDLKDVVSVISSSVGNVTENDVVLAQTSGAVISCFNVKVEPKARDLAKALNVAIEKFDIIYRLVEFVEDRAKSFLKPKVKYEKTGEAFVKKVFDIKKLGKVAGFGVKQGKIFKDSKVEVYRGQDFIGEGLIKSLQKEKKTIKEVGVGFEGAMILEGFDNWEEEDRIVAFARKNEA